MDRILLANNTMRKAPGSGISLAAFADKETARVRKFHRSFEQYRITPLHRLDALARMLGIEALLVKDESWRFGLNAFKVLGGAYAIGRVLADALHIPPDELTLLAIKKAQPRHTPTFVTATDGNHGRGIAWTAAALGCKAVVYMPKGSAPIRVRNITATGARCIVTDLNYDATVQLASQMATQNGWFLVQDTAWDGYEEIPGWIMQGYTSIGMEILEQLEQMGADMPTHVLLQAGVGSFAAAISAYLISALGAQCPRIVIVEPHQANCIYCSMLAADGLPRTVDGDLNTVMAGLACGIPSTTGWKILRDYAQAAISCPDWIAANGMRRLSSPCHGDTRIIAGESGAVSCGLIDWVMQMPDPSIRQALSLESNARVLLINTEGDTSPEIWHKIVHYGLYPAPQGMN